MGGQCIGLLSNESGNLYLAELMSAFVDAAEVRRFRAVVLLGRTWRSPVDNEALHNLVFRFLPYLGLRGQVVASALLSTYQPLHDLPAFAGLSDDNSVYLGGALRPGQFSVELEATAAIRSAIRHLVLEHGCARVGCITGPSNNPETILRLRAYRQAVRELGLVWRPDWEECGCFTVEGGQQAVHALMERIPGIEGVFFMSDAMALGAMQYFEKARVPGHRRPRYIAFDDIAELQFLDIPLSTIAQPLDRIMEECVRRLAGDDVSLHADVPAALVLRRSCGCEGSGGKVATRSAFRDGLDLLFSQQRLRLAAQGLFSSSDAQSWDQRMAMTLQRMGIPWACILEWRGEALPVDLGTAAFHRLAEYTLGEPQAVRSVSSPSPAMLADVIRSRTGNIVVAALVFGEYFMGLLLLDHVPGLEQTYDALAAQIGAALHASRGGVR
jgi:DNA-binding LacI/PurR family transcriptional regulator